MGSGEITFEIVTSAIVDMEKLKDPQETWTATDNGKGSTLWMPYREYIVHQHNLRIFEQEKLQEYNIWVNSRGY